MIESRSQNVYSQNFLYARTRAFMPHSIAKRNLLSSRFCEIHDNFEPRKFGAIYTVSPLLTCYAKGAIILHTLTPEASINVDAVDKVSTDIISGSALINIYTVVQQSK